MTYKATKNWAGNYTYRGYTLNKNGRLWDVFDNARYQNRSAYGWTLSDAKQKVDNIIDRGCKFKDA